MVLQGPDKGRRFELPDKPALVGRESRQLPLSDNTVSRRHAELLPGDEGWTLRDLGSSNGTYINGLRVTNRYTLKLGDQIRVGRTLMVYGSQPGVSRARGGDVSLTGEEEGLDASIMHTVPSNDDSMVLSVPEPAAAAMTNLKVLYQLGAALGSSFDTQQVLEVVMDLVFEHVKADRGIILLVDEKTNEVVPKVVRTREEQEKLKEGASQEAELREAQLKEERREAQRQKEDTHTPLSEAGAVPSADGKITPPAPSSTT
jgi:predicted component of type VI protein secretion system